MTITAGDGSQLPQVSQPLSEILEGFLRAQRLDLYPPQELAPGIVALQADDDESLVNSYVTYDPPPGSPPPDLESLVRVASVDPNRTDIVIADALAGKSGKSGNRCSDGRIACCRCRNAWMDFSGPRASATS